LKNKLRFVKAVSVKNSPLNLFSYD
jgi:hypothetical protein